MSWRWLLGGAVVLGAALRVWHLDGQSFWFDESVTVQLLGGSFSGLLEGVARSESTPPLYYLLGWPWTRVFGDGEAGLRSLSVVCGVLTIPAAWAAARQVADERAAATAALLVAVNPLLVWYSQEARAYALLALLGTVATWLALRAARTGSRRDLGLWALSAAASLTAHYFAVFVVVGQIAVLTRPWWPRRGELVAAVCFVGAAGAALIPLARHQEQDGRTAWISSSDLRERGWDVVELLATASTGMVSTNSPAPDSPLKWLVFAALAVGAVLVARAVVARGHPAATLERDRSLSGAAALTLVGGLGLAVPLLLALTPLDFFKDRNLIAAWPALFAALGVLLGARSSGWAGLVAAAAVGVAGVGVTLEVANRPELQRDDWRGVAQAMGTPREGRAVVVQPAFSRAPLLVYGHELAQLPPDTAVREIVLVGHLDLPQDQAPPGPVGFRVVERVRTNALSMIRYRRDEPFVFDAAALRDAGGRVLFEVGDGARAWIARYVAALTRLRDAAQADDRATLRAASSVIAALDPIPAELPAAPGRRRAIAAAARAAEAYASSPSAVRRRALDSALVTAGAR